MNIEQYSRDSRLQVEVSVQNFYESSQLKAANLESSQANTESIAAEIWETWFHRWLEILQPNLQLAPAYELSLRLTDDAEVQALNAQYRHQDKPTDVLAFAALEVEYPQIDQSHLPLYLGDIVISIDTATRQAQQQEHTLQTELAWLAAHGLLHLLGWDHPDENSLKQMLNQQNMLLQAVGVPINAE